MSHTWMLSDRTGHNGKKEKGFELHVGQVNSPSQDKQPHTNAYGQLKSPINLALLGFGLVCTVFSLLLSHGSHSQFLVWPEISFKFVLVAFLFRLLRHLDFSLEFAPQHNKRLILGILISCFWTVEVRQISGDHPHKNMKTPFNQEFLAAITTVFYISETCKCCCSNNGGSNQHSSNINWMHHWTAQWMRWTKWYDVTTSDIQIW